MASWAAVTISLLAFAVSAYTLWRTHLAPASLVVIPPAITQANDGLPSLIFDLSIFNDGAKPSVLSDFGVRCHAHGSELGLQLHVQKTLDVTQKYSGLPLTEDTRSAVFVPVVLKGRESTPLRLYCAPYENELPASFADVVAVETLSVDVTVDGRRARDVFVLGYPDFRTKFKDNKVVVPETGFAPRWYREARPVRL